VKRFILFGLLATMLIVGTGCGLGQAIFGYRPCMMRGDCDCGVCGAGCEDDCGPVYGPRGRAVRGPVAPRRAWMTDDCGDDCGVACGRPCRPSVARRCAPCGDPCWDPCGDCCYGRCWHRGPLSCVFALLMGDCWWGRTCGERYWGDFYSDPPDCWDPCDCYGNYTGNFGKTSCRGCNRRPGRYYTDGYAEGYIDEGMDVGSMPVSEGKIISQSDRAVSPAPAPVAQPHRAVKPRR
jgi:hypothetical protein